VSVLAIVEALDGAPDFEPSVREVSDPQERAAAGAVWRAAGDAYQDVLAHTTVSDLAERELQLGAGGSTYEI
jgi:DNA-binding IscR family transcriptional regulator